MPDVLPATLVGTFVACCSCCIYGTVGAWMPASLVRPWLRFHIPLIEPDWRIARIRLSDKTSRLHPRRATTKLGQAYEAEVLVKARVDKLRPCVARPRA